MLPPLTQTHHPVPPSPPIVVQPNPTLPTTSLSAKPMRFDNSNASGEFALYTELQHCISPVLHVVVVPPEGWLLRAATKKCQKVIATT